MRARRSLAVVWTVIFLDLLGFGVVLPSLAYFVHLFPVPEAAQSLGARLGLEDVGAVFVGLIQTSYSVFQFVFAPIWGRLSDRIGRRPVLVASMGGFVLAWVTFALAESMTSLLLARALAGVFGANVSAAQAYVGDVYPPEQRARGMGLIGMAFGLGFVFGPALGAFLASDLVLGWFAALAGEGGIRGRLLVTGSTAAIFSLAAFLVALFALGESLPPEARGAKARRNELVELVEALRAPGLGSMLLVYFVVTAGFSSLEAMFSQFNYAHLGLGHSANGVVFTVIGLTLAAVQGGLIGRMTARLGSERVLMIGLGGLAVTMAAFGFQRQLNPGLPPLALLIVLSVATGAFFSLCNPSVLAIISSRAQAHAQGLSMGFTASSSTLGRIVGPLAGGLIYAAIGPEWPFGLGALLILLALALFLGFARSE